VREPSQWDWLGATIGWGMASIFAGVFLTEGLGVAEEIGVMTAMALFFGGAAWARVWWLRRPVREAEGLTTGEAHLVRQEELEMRVAELEALHNRVAELEDRLEFSERLIARGANRLPQDQGHA